jgi:hypothetical protein
MNDRTCDRCNCNNTEENPIFEILDNDFNIEEWVCMMCYVEEVNDAEG